MAQFAKGDNVRQIITPIQGTVQGFQVDQESGDLLVLVGWTDEQGEHARYFTQAEIETVSA